MKNSSLVSCLLLVQFLLSAQSRLPVYPDSLFSTYYHQRVSHFRTLPQTEGDIIFIGNSITDGGEWSEWFDDQRVKNRGISGDNTAGIIHRIGEVAERKPAKLFLMIGTNDLARGLSPDSVVKNMVHIISYLRWQTPATQVYVQSILPVNAAFGRFAGHTSKQAQIKQVNEQLATSAASQGFHFIDLNTSFSDAAGNLKPELTNDGLHLNGRAYSLWKQLVFPLVFDRQPKPALIPLPQQLQWTDGSFTLYDCKTIVAGNDSLMREGARLQQELKAKGWNMQLQQKVPGKGTYIQLQIGKVSAPQLQQEAYTLDVSPGRILLTANTMHGIFYGMQTLLQLLRNGSAVDACRITDWPAFAWRGYMVDVGRNYQSMDLLKQQVEIMSRYKLNIFHFHFTEDIAWRLAIKQYPQLTEAGNMLRNKGQYYTEMDFKELIAFCRERYITVVPEIDMPGHSAAFRRAMKTDMQTDSGLLIVKNIMREFFATYDLPHFHIGADEVKITNPAFVPEVIAFAKSFGKKVIGWEPGGNFTDDVIRQLWMDDLGKIAANANIRYIDSRHLYLNHMDPLEAVVTIFNRRIGDKEKGDASLLGGTLCLWPDRRVENEEDVLKINPVYPGILAFAERSWRGGGQAGWVANIGKPGEANTNEFAAFEGRLLDHKQQYFTGLPFPYAKQSSIVWNLYGPYANNGNLSEKFAPELPGFDTTRTHPALQVAGGTVVLRHWWAPLIKGALEKPEENTTWYATTKIWSAEDAVGAFWIGFNNLSRSPATDPPPASAWDAKQSMVWVNGNGVPPPQWKRGGAKGHPEVPLVDEGYEYRAPTFIQLKKGWNPVLIKAPVGSFRGPDWQNPVKWMFTFVPL